MSVIGVDEVGRGAWAGPLVVGAVQLSCQIDGLKDSKVLTAAARQKLADKIYESCDHFGFGWVEPGKVDELGLTAATRLAMEIAVKSFPSDAEIIIDGRLNYLSGRQNTQTLVRADSSIPAVSAASVIAKVARDEYMKKQSRTYSCYGFETNVGYGTSFHREAIEKFGLCSLHRRSWKPLKLYGSA